MMIFLVKLSQWTKISTLKIYKRKIYKDFQNISIVFYNYILMNYNIFPNKLKFESSIEGNKPVNFTIKEEKP